ncbi:SGNH hydrolase [Punctularia strigosozonata HHB-11173 SS5]|uniref:SGNH hydrolase n=1 Tax=Punctularia strigosozonata (strain HHB-11173) TaxID=741275 RepID=UPI00044167D3|nr:SGNH hydrolase [Punctularia strigosozonata HHB-11173 SS5]EIN07809.1 SGNH hydrolase [Punctularia strigosozonata HHB-11173 SS5]
MDQIWLLGDSLTQGGYEIENKGFAARLAHAYIRKLDIVNRGLSGYNTTWALRVFKQIWPVSSSRGPKIHLIAIWYGANDAAIPPKAQHVPIEEFRANLEELVDVVRNPESKYYSPVTKIILITPPPVNTHQWGAFQASKVPPQPLDRDFEVTKAYAQAVRDVGAALSVPVADVWTPVWKAAGESEEALKAYLIDGLHLNADGYDIVYGTLLETIASNYPELGPERLSPVFPFTDEIDHNNLDGSLKARSPFSQRA